mmetsp:Transcript_4110/g.8967  ORF Transcript_4110/g.8967 Transcript_4110/m.8967 type:complete len:102 (-) Transcript_4110:750-1055(-)
MSSTAYLQDMPGHSTERRQHNRAKPCMAGSIHMVSKDPYTWLQQEQHQTAVCLWSVRMLAAHATLVRTRAAMLDGCTPLTGACPAPSLPVHTMQPLTTPGA